MTEPKPVVLPLHHDPIASAKLVYLSITIPNVLDEKVRAFSLLGAENLFYLDFIDEKEGAISCSSRVPFGNTVFGHSVHLDKARGAAGEVERVAGDAVAGWLR